MSKADADQHHFFQSVVAKLVSDEAVEKRTAESDQCIGYTIAKWLAMHTGSISCMQRHMKDN